MRLLLDTHAVLWWHDDDTRLSVPARRAISRADLVLVSAASAWEVAIKIGLGKLRLPIPFEEVVTRNGFAELSVTVRHAAEVADVRLEHRDPFDRMLVAQALVEGATLVTRDKALGDYGVPVLW